MLMSVFSYIPLIMLTLLFATALFYIRFLHNRIENQKINVAFLEANAKIKEFKK